MYYVLTILLLLALIYAYNSYKIWKKFKEFGPIRQFLAPLIDSLEKDYLSYKIINANNGRYKVICYADNHSITYDFIYLANKIQTTVVVKGGFQKTTLVWVTPYSCSDVANELMNRLG